MSLSFLHAIQINLIRLNCQFSYLSGQINLTPIFCHRNSSRRRAVGAVAPSRRPSSCTHSSTFINAVIAWPSGLCGPLAHCASAGRPGLWAESESESSFKFHGQAVTVRVYPIWIVHPAARASGRPAGRGRRASEGLRAESESESSPLAGHLFFV